MKLLELQQLTCSFDVSASFRLRRVKKPVLQGVTLSVAHGEAVGIVGQSGSGKSTLARCIAGLQRPDSGTILFDGLNVFPTEGKRKCIPCDIQMVFQASGASLDPTMKVHDILMEGITARTKVNGKYVQGIAYDLIEMVGMEPDLLSRLPIQLSGGERQRIAFARALAAQPRLLILDEPTSALDVLTQNQILSLLRNLQLTSHVSMLFITHDLGVALEVCDRIAVLHEGIIVEDALAHDIITSPKHLFTQQLVHESLL